MIALGCNIIKLLQCCIAYIDTHTIELYTMPTKPTLPDRNLLTFKKSITNTNNKLVIALKDAREGQLRDQVVIVHIENVIECVLNA